MLFRMCSAIDDDEDNINGNNTGALSGYMCAYSSSILTFEFK